MQKIITIPTTKITDWNSFYEIFQKVFHFLEYYGKNMNAWIDCMNDTLDDLKNDELALKLENGEDFIHRCGEQYKSLVDAVAFINMRLSEEKSKKLIKLI